MLKKFWGRLRNKATAIWCILLGRGVMYRIIISYNSKTNSYRFHNEDSFALIENDFMRFETQKHKKKAPG